MGAGVESGEVLLRCGSAEPGWVAYGLWCGAVARNRPGWRRAPWCGAVARNRVGLVKGVRCGSAEPGGWYWGRCGSVEPGGGVRGMRPGVSAALRNCVGSSWGFGEW